MVSLADRGQAQAHVARSTPAHHLSRDHLHLHWRHTSGRVAKTPDRLDAPRAKAKLMPCCRGEYRSGQMPDARVSEHPYTPTRGQRPGVPQALRGRSHHECGQPLGWGCSARAKLSIGDADQADTEATVACALEGFTAKLRSFAGSMRQTLTYDHGNEMTRHAELAANTGVVVYFCDTQSPWQHGSGENTNGLIDSSCPRSRTCPRTARSTSMPSPNCSRTALAPSKGNSCPSASTKPCWTSSINTTPQFNKSVLHLVLDSAKQLTDLRRIKPHQ
jgi:hypothetical protein